MNSISRRKFINISGVAIGMCFLSIQAKENQEKFTWKGTALGADASMTLYHTNQNYINQTINECIDEIRKLERIFSLFYRNSAVVHLNKYRILNNPPKELIELLLMAQNISQLSNGAFDVTVQPLWIMYNSFFSKKNASNYGPSKKEIKQTKKLVNWKKLIIKNNKIKLTEKGMKITLNGIAQGYITDKITNLLKNKGFTNVLVNLGEIRTIGKHPSGRNWQIAVPYSNEVNNNSGFIKLNNQAIASSGGYGTSFNKTYHHLFNPHSGKSSNFVKAVSVIASTATLADSLSTTVAVISKEKSQKLLKLFPNVTSYIS